MPQNINSYKKERKELNKVHDEITNKCIFSHKILFDNLALEKTKITKKELDIYKNDFNESCQNLVDLAIWTISKDQPLIDDLRFTIFCINSVRDFERIFDYSYNIMKYLIKSGIQEQVIDNIKKMHCNIIELLEEYNELSWKASEKSIYEFIETIQKVQSKQSNVINKLINDDNSYSVMTIFSLKAIDRITDHILSLVQLRLFVKNGQMFNTSIQN